jgi:peptidoglycan hydrolase-like protein with peptidoglycan-binding domain
MYLTDLATRAPLSGSQTQPRMTAHDVLCVHTMVGSLAGTRAMFQANGYGGTESHFGTGGGGELEQWQDLAFTADANYQGNRTVISVENADLGPGFTTWNTNDGSAVPAFTDAQLHTLTALGVAACLPGNQPGSMHAGCPHDWACYQSGIPARLIPDTKPGRRGLAYHAQGVPGNELVPGGVQWSDKRGKVCPGRRRIAQIKTELIPAIAAAVNGTAPTPAPVRPPAAPIAPPTVKAPAFPLPAGHWYGPESNDPHNHSGYAAADRPGILTWQQRMAARGWKITPDGRYGPQSAGVARAFQQEKGLHSDGLCGARTWAASFVTPVTR